MRWIRQAANHGSAQAAAALGKAYREGLYGLPKDEQQAQIWYERSGQQFR
jgi:TPR repeat protein